jgi:hypothetical protein
VSEGYLFLSLHITRYEINHTKFILQGFKNVVGFVRWGTLHSLSLTPASRPPAVGYPRLLIQRNRSCHPPPAGRLCQQQPKSSPYHTNNSRHLSQRRSLWNVVSLYPQIRIYTHSHITKFGAVLRQDYTTSFDTKQCLCTWTQYRATRAGLRYIRCFCDAIVHCNWIDI